MQTDTHTSSSWLARVDGQPITAEEVDELLVEVGGRSRPFETATPSQVRLLRRWLIHVLATVQILESEADVHGLSYCGHPALDLPDALSCGSILAAALRRAPRGRAVFHVFLERSQPTASQVSAVQEQNSALHGWWGSLGSRSDGRVVTPETAIAMLIAVNIAVESLTDWLAGEFDRRVELSPEAAHPGDPSYPEFTHHH